MLSMQPLQLAILQVSCSFSQSFFSPQPLFRNSLLLLHNL